MVLAKFNEFITELVGFIKKSKVPFSNGLMKTDNDSVLGYSAKMQNMVIENGIAVKRRGSFLLNDGDEPQKYYLLENIYIGASEFLIGVNHDRELIAHFKRFPEKTMRIYRNHFKRNKAVSFTRGIQFFLISTPSGYTVVNEFGDAYAIKDNGVLRISQVPDDGIQEYYYPADEYLRDIGEEFALYLDIVEATNKELVDFTIAEDNAGDTIPIKGDIRCAYVNENGVTSKLSEPINLTDYMSVIIGLNDIETTRRDFKTTDDASIYDIVKHVSPQEGFDSTSQTLVTLEASVALSGSAVIESYTDSATLTYLEKDVTTTIGSILVLVVDANRDGSVVFPVHWSSSADDDQLDAIMNAMEGVAKEDYNGRYKAQIWGSLNAPATTATAIDVTDITEFSTQPIITIGIDATTDYDKTISISGATLTWVSTTRTVGKENTPVIAWKDCDNEMMKPFPYTKDKESTGFIVKIFYDTSDDTLIPMYPVMNANVIDKDYIFNHKGYDTWNLVEQIGIGGFQNTGFKPMSNGVELSPASYLEAVNAVTPNDVGTDDPYTDDQFAVWNNDYIISKSQKILTFNATGNPDTDEDIVYSVEDNATETKKQSASGVSFYRVISQIPVSLNEKYMSFTKPIYQTLRRVAHKYNTATEILRDVRDIAANGAVLCAIRSNRLWLGNSLTLLLDRQLELSGFIYSVTEFMDGFVIFTSTGGYYLKTTGDIKRINGMTDTTANVIYAYAGVGGVYGIDSLGRVIIVTQREIFDGVLVVSYQVISQSINSYKFSSESVMTEVDGVLYIGDEDTLFGFRSGVWVTEQKFSQTIDDVVYPKRISRMSALEDKLVIFFYDYPSEETIDFSSDSGAGA